MEKIKEDTDKLQDMVNDRVDTSLEHGISWWKCSTCKTNNWKRIEFCEECTRTRYEYKS